MPIKDLNSQLFFALNGEHKPIIHLDSTEYSSVNFEPMQFSTDASFEIPISFTDDYDTIMKALIPDDFYSDFNMTIGVPIKVQIRRHRRKRINKKWAKRYGYKTIIKDVECIIDTFTDDCDGRVSFEGKILPNELKKVI